MVTRIVPRTRLPYFIDKVYFHSFGHFLFNVPSTHLSSIKHKMDPATYISKSANELIEIVDENNQSLNAPLTRGEMRCNLSEDD
jgi:hypothetical protein